MGIGQVNKTVSQMTQILQQNVALVERVSVASRALAEQPKALRNTAAVLRLRDDYTVTDCRLTSAAAPWDRRTLTTFANSAIGACNGIEQSRYGKAPTGLRTS